MFKKLTTLTWTRSINLLIIALGSWIKPFLLFWTALHIHLHQWHTAFLPKQSQADPWPATSLLNDFSIAFKVYSSSLMISFDGLQHARPPCLSPSPRVCPSSCPLHQWCQPPISSSDALFSFCPQSFPASGTFPIVSQLFATGDQNTGALASASVLFCVAIVDPFIIALLCCLNKPHAVFIHYSLYQTFACFTFGLL